MRPSEGVRARVYEALAREQGIKATVVFTDTLGRAEGEARWDAGSFLISLKRGLTASRELEVFAHELSHCLLNHPSRKPYTKRDLALCDFLHETIVEGTAHTLGLLDAQGVRRLTERYFEREQQADLLGIELVELWTVKYL